MSKRKKVNSFNEFCNEKKSAEHKFVIAYHGTPHGKFEKFLYRKKGTGADDGGIGDYGRGYYFTPEKEMAINYAHGVGEKLKERGRTKETKPVVYTVELRMNNPFDLRKLSALDKDMLVLFREYGMLNVPNDKYVEALHKNGFTEEEHEFYLDFENLIEDNWADWNIRKKLFTNGYDCLINRSGLEYVIFDARQIRIIGVEELQHDPTRVPWSKAS